MAGIVQNGDNKVLEVQINVIKISNTFKTMLEEMGKIGALLAVSAAILVAYVIQKEYLSSHVKLPDLKDEYFGSGQRKVDSKSIDPFKVQLSNRSFNELLDALKSSKIVDPLEDEGTFQYGFNLEYLKEVLRYWREEYDWLKHEAIINSFANFETQVHGLKVHFIHQKVDRRKYKEEQIRPLLLVHGWPGSIWEFYKLIPILTDPAAHGFKQTDFAFDVVAPSIPGYGFSQAPKKKGFNQVAAARIFAKLMDRLGYQTFYTQGGDWGSFITTIIAQLFPDRVKGLHLNMAFVSPTIYPTLFAQYLFGTAVPSLFFNAEDYRKVYPISEKLGLMLQESGYMHIQGTKPDTVGVALTNSPLGLAAYILEKFSTWTHPAYREFKNGGLLRHFTMDELLTNVMIYWMTDSITSSVRFYKEYFEMPDRDLYERAPVHPPSGFACFPHELLVSPQKFLAYKFRNIITYTDMPRGGHFPALEEPQLLATDVQKFVTDVEYFPKH